MDPAGMGLFLGSGEAYDLDGDAAAFELQPEKMAVGAAEATADSNGHAHGDEDEDSSDFVPVALAHDGFNLTFVGTEEAVFKWDGRQVGI